MAHNSSWQGCALYLFCLFLFSSSDTPIVGVLDGMNENGLHRLLHLNACSPVHGTIWEELGGMALEDMLWLLVLRFQNPMPCHSQLAFSASHTADKV